MAVPTTRRRQISLSSSRSVPNLTSIDPSSAYHSPAITLDEGTPRTPAAPPLLPRTSTPSYSNSTDYADYADADANASDHDTDAEFNSHYPAQTRSSSTSSSSTTSSASASSSTNSSPAPLVSDYQANSNVRRSHSAAAASTSALPRSASAAHLSAAHLAASFAPPFYNRPPIPLPPSPSLTSLLRPSFSATTSRPTTPDESENDTPNDTEAAVAKSARTATIVGRVSPKVPTYEYYGFVLYLSSTACFLMYILWSYLPSPFLHQLGIYYYPNRWWSLAIPAFLVALIVYIYVALACYNTEVLTLPVNSIRNLVDETANVAVLDAEGKIRHSSRYRSKEEGAKEARRTARESGKRRKRREKGRRRQGDGVESSDERDEGESMEWDWKKLWSEGTDAVMDVPIAGVCEVLYGD